jgi:hypothetical protein
MVARNLDNPQGDGTSLIVETFTVKNTPHTAKFSLPIKRFKG